MLPLYIHRTSPVHRLPAGAKLAASFIAGGLLFFVGKIWLLALILGLTCSLYRLAELPARTILTALRPILIIGAIIFIVQLYFAGLEDALLVVIRLMTLILLTSLVTLTTRFSDMLSVLSWATQPFAIIGISPARLALMVSLTIRFIPTLLHDLHEIRQAKLARGATGLRAFGAGPLIIKVLRMTDALGYAITSRGFENRD